MNQHAEHVSRQIAEMHDDIKRQGKKILHQGHAQSADISGLIASVTAGRGVDESNKILLEGIAEQLEHSDDPAMKALAVTLRESNDKLLEALNTVPA